MADLIDITQVRIGPENMTALVRLDDDAPLMTSDDLDGTARIYRLLPHIVDHACLGDAGETFREAMGDTEIAHLLEHVTVELLAQTNLAGDMPAGRTWVDEVDDRTYQIELACPDDVLVASALSCGVWLLDWAYKGGEEPEPDVDAIVGGLVQLVERLGDEGEDYVIDYGDEPFEDDGSEEFYEDEPYDEDAAYEDELETGEPEADAAPEPVEEERPLWTPAPEVTTVMQRIEVGQESEAEAEQGPEVEAEIDEIMATIEQPPIVAEDLDELDEP